MFRCCYQTWRRAPQLQQRHDYFLRRNEKERKEACHRDQCVVCVFLRCADAAVLPVGSCEADSRKPQDVPAAMELVESSQGSPIINPPARMLLLPQIGDSNRPGGADEACDSATTTPASSTVTRASCWWFISFVLLVLDCLFSEAGRMGVIVRSQRASSVLL